MKQLVCSLILRRIDYCDSILIGLPASSVALLQCVFRMRPLRARHHVTSALVGLHWLPILYRIQYKVALTMFFIQTNQCPAYLGNIVTPLHDNPSRQRLRSSTGTDYLIPRTRTKLGERSFSVAGPTISNSLPETVSAVTCSLNSFFDIAFNSSSTLVTL